MKSVGFEFYSSATRREYIQNTSGVHGPSSDVLGMHFYIFRNHEFHISVFRVALESKHVGRARQKNQKCWIRVLLKCDSSGIHRECVRSAWTIDRCVSDAYYHTIHEFDISVFRVPGDSGDQRIVIIRNILGFGFN